MEAKDSIGDLLQKIGNVVRNAYQSMKEIMTSKQEIENMIETRCEWRIWSYIDVYNIQRDDSIV